MSTQREPRNPNHGGTVFTILYHRGDDLNHCSRLRRVRCHNGLGVEHEVELCAGHIQSRHGEPLDLRGAATHSATSSRKVGEPLWPDTSGHTDIPHANASTHHGEQQTRGEQRGRSPLKPDGMPPTTNNGSPGSNGAGVAAANTAGDGNERAFEGGRS